MKQSFQKLVEIFALKHRQGLKIIFLVSMSEYDFQLKWFYATYTAEVALGMSKPGNAQGTPLKFSR